MIILLEELDKNCPIISDDNLLCQYCLILSVWTFQTAETDKSLLISKITT